jgi:hypothetical protein
VKELKPSYEWYSFWQKFSGVIDKVAVSGIDESSQLDPD